MPKWLLAIVTIGGAVVILGLAGFFYFGLPRTLRSIMPPVNASPSTSMEDHEIVMRMKFDAKVKRRSSTGELIEWRLKMPRAFVWSEIGDNDTVSETYEGLHNVSILALYDPATGGFVPGIFELKKNNADVDHVFMRVSNYPSGQNMMASGLCRRIDDFLERSGPSRSCKPDDGNKRCTVYFSFKGWSVDLLIPKKQYFGNYRSYCQKVDDFLRHSTIAITPVPY